MVLALRCPPPTGCARRAHCIGSFTVPATVHKRRHDACSHATGPRYAMLGPARPSPVSCCMMYHWAIAVHLCEGPSSSFGSFASSHPSLRASLSMGCFCTHMSWLQEQQQNCLLLAVGPRLSTVRFSYAPPVRLEIRLAPGSVATDSCDAAVCSPVHWLAAAAAQLLRVMNQDLTTRPPDDNLPWPCQSVLACSVEGPSTSLACATGVRTTIHAHTMSKGLVRLAGEGLEKGKSQYQWPSSTRAAIEHPFPPVQSVSLFTESLRYPRAAFSSRSSFCRDNPAHLPLSACYVVCCLLLTGLWRACA
jgi:hypothetical protein